MNKIQIVAVRGDIRPVLFSVQDFYGEFSDLPFDEITFVVRRGTSDKTILFKKALTDGQISCDKTGHYRIAIRPEDTHGLVYGRYVFQLTLIYGTVVKQTTVGSFYIYDGMSSVPLTPETRCCHCGVDFVPIRLSTPVHRTDLIASYNDLADKPSINGVTLQGDLTLEELGIRPIDMGPTDPLTEEDLEIIIGEPEKNIEEEEYDV